jgi:hypothetical protein
MNEKRSALTAREGEREGDGGYAVVYKINYNACYANNFKCNVQEAVKFYLNQGTEFKYGEEEYGGFILYPQALNPFLKILETMRETRNIVILPAYSQDVTSPEDFNNPAYLIIKLGGDASYIKGIFVDTSILDVLM